MCEVMNLLENLKQLMKFDIMKQHFEMFNICKQSELVNLLRLILNTS